MYQMNMLVAKIYVRSVVIFMPNSSMNKLKGNCAKKDDLQTLFLYDNKLLCGVPY